MNYINQIALKNQDETYNVIVEICPGNSGKNELVEPSFDKLVCVRNVEGVYPFYYGSFPQTYAGDKDPLDVILFTDIEHKELDIVKVDVIGAIKTVDAGEQDDKIICVESDCGLTNLKKQLKKAMKFLKAYKGKDANMQIEKDLVSMKGAEELVSMANDAYIKHMKDRSTILSRNSALLRSKVSNIRVVQRR